MLLAISEQSLYVSHSLPPFIDGIGMYFHRDVEEVFDILSLLVSDLLAFSFLCCLNSIVYCVDIAGAYEFDLPLVECRYIIRPPVRHRGLDVFCKHTSRLLS